MNNRPEVTTEQLRARLEDQREQDAAERLQRLLGASTLEINDVDEVRDG